MKVLIILFFAITLIGCNRQVGRTTGWAIDASPEKRLKSEVKSQKTQAENDSLITFVSHNLIAGTKPVQQWEIDEFRISFAKVYGIDSLVSLFSNMDTISPNNFTKYQTRIFCEWKSLKHEYETLLKEGFFNHCKCFVSCDNVMFFDSISSFEHYIMSRNNKVDLNPSGRYLKVRVCEGNLFWKFTTPDNSIKSKIDSLSSISISDCELVRNDTLPQNTCGFRYVMIRPTSWE